MSDGRIWSFIPWTMGMSTNSHAKKSDKETQSPMLKIFKEIMQRETPGSREVPLNTADIDKGATVREKRKKKRKQYSSLHSQKSVESSGVEHIKRTAQYNVAERNRAFCGDRTQSHFPFPSEKRDSWWVWETCSRRNGSTSCSCVSCQFGSRLKKIFSNEYTCIACLIVLFMISVFIAFFLVFKTIALVPETPDTLELAVTEKSELDSHSLESLQKGDEDIKKVENGRGMRRSVWDDSMSNYVESSYGEQEFSDNYPKMSNVVNSDGRFESDLASLLEPIRGDPHISPRLLSFYKKLIEADEQIKHLKKGIYEKQEAIQGDSKNVFRLKRSLFHSNKHDKGTTKKTNDAEEGVVYKVKEKENKINHDKKANHDKKHGKTKKKLDKVKAHKKLNRGRRFFNDSLPDGIVIEKKRLFVKYSDNSKPKFPKCTHCPQDSKSHEHKMNHPFYKNSQKLEELLDQFLDKNLDDLMPDEFGFRKLMNKPPKKFKCQHHDTTKSATTTAKKPAIKTTKRIETTTLAPTTTAVKLTTNPNQKLVQFTSMTTDFYDKYLKPKFRKIAKTMSTLPKREDSVRNKVLVSSDGRIQYVTETQPSYDIVLSVSTIINKRVDEDTTRFSIDKLIPNMPSRRLLQTDDEEEDSVGYEDFKEVLSDDMTAHDETDRQIERVRRQESRMTEANPVKNNPSGVFNHNWKGPVPLYPDEMTSMIKHVGETKPESPSQPEPDTPNKQSQYIDPNHHVPYRQEGLNDVDYVEDYLNDKYERLAQMAQAYSDYGVLADKKDVLKSEKAQDKGGKISASAASVRVKKETADKPVESEGLSIQLKPFGHQRCDDDPAELLKILGKHFRITNDISSPVDFEGTTLVPVHPSLGIMYSPKDLPEYYRRKSPKLTLKSEDLFNDIVIVNNKVGRSLKSVTEGKHDATAKLPTNIFNQSETENLENLIQDKMKEAILIFNYNKTASVVKRSILDDLDKKLAMSSNANAASTPVSADLTTDNLPSLENTESTEKTTSHTEAVTKYLEQVTTVIAKKKLEKSPQDLDPGEFFQLLSNWFHTLAKASEETEVIGKNRSSEVSQQNKTGSPKNYSKVAVTAKLDNDVLYPMEDLDMVDNIGHRSRVLMSVEEDGHRKMVTRKVKTVVEPSNKITFSTSSKEITKKLKINLTEDANATSKEGIILEDEVKGNKSLVKRNAESKLVFWNNMYDDEYGIKMDPMDPMDQTKDSGTNSDIVKKSAVWIQDKVRQMTESIKKRSKEGLNRIYSNNRDSREMDGELPGAHPRDEFKIALHKITKRGDDSHSDNPLDKKAGIAMLTAHMQDICKKASQAVQKTRNIRQNEGSQSQVASGLMQQLVKLMGDLVDYEVQQKTCIKLPEDLKDFLDWLTRPVASPSAQQSGTQNLQVEPAENDPLLIIPTTSSVEKEEGKLDVRSECLGTLLAVQDLIQEFSQLSEEDKSKMGGVREYLEDQLEFLHKQLNSSDETNLANIYSKGYIPFRFRRDVSDLKDADDELKQIGDLPNNQRIKRKLRRFLKTYGKKHTRTTASNFESMEVPTEIYGKEKFDHSDSIVKPEDIKVQIEENTAQDKMESKRDVTAPDTDTDITEKTKRNLQDVYYKALEDAKKLTTMKNMLSNAKDYDDFDKGSSNSRQ